MHFVKCRQFCSKLTYKMKGRNGRQVRLHAVVHLKPEQITNKKYQDTEICESLWKETEYFRNQALQTEFVQGLKCATLDPTDFGGYMVQDSVYCYKAKEALDFAASKAKQDGLKSFLQEQAKSYEQYYKDLYADWHIKSNTGIRLNSACQKYVDEFTTVAQDWDSIYLVAACIPCARLWPWLGQQLEKSQHNYGCYSTWVQENFDPTSESYKKLEAFVNAAYVQGLINRTDLRQIYSTCMKCEADFFSSATS